MDETKICNVCKEEKLLTDFYFRKDRNIYRPNCKKCKPLNRKADIMHRVATQTTKVCTMCNEEKPVSEYQKAGGGKWLQPYCKPCDAIRKQKYVEENREKVLTRRREYYVCNKPKIIERNNKYRDDNIVIVKERHKKYRDKNIDDIRLKQRIYSKENRKELTTRFREKRHANKEFYKEKGKKNRANRTPEQKKKLSDWSREWKKKNREKILANREKNREKIRERNRVYNNNKSATDICFRILKNLRGRTRFALKKWDTIKSDTTENLLGCSIPYFKEYFSSLFTEGMNWDLFMQGKIHIDHIIPCVHFDLRDEMQQRICFNFKNLQPLWELDNLRKGVSLIELKAS